MRHSNRPSIGQHLLDPAYFQLPYQNEAICCMLAFVSQPRGSTHQACEPAASRHSSLPSRSKGYSASNTLWHDSVTQTSSSVGLETPSAQRQRLAPKWSISPRGHHAGRRRANEDLPFAKRQLGSQKIIMVDLALGLQRSSSVQVLRVSGRRFRSCGAGRWGRNWAGPRGRSCCDDHHPQPPNVAPTHSVRWARPCGTW